MTTLICPISLIQFELATTLIENTILYRHPSVNSRESILRIENKLKRFHAILVWNKVIPELTDISEFPQRTKFMSGLDLTDNEIEKIIWKLGFKSLPRIEPIKSTVFSAFMREFLIGSSVGSIANTASNSHPSYTAQKKRASQIINTINELFKGTRYIYLAFPKNREQAKGYANMLDASKGENLRKAKALLEELSNNQAFNDEQSKDGELDL